MGAETMGWPWLIPTTALVLTLSLSKCAHASGYSKQAALRVDGDALGVNVLATGTETAVAIFNSAPFEAPNDRFTSSRWTNDGGRTWAAPIEVSPLEDRGLSNRSLAPVLANGRVVVVWASPLGSIFSDVSADGGMGWRGTPTELTGVYYRQGPDLSSDGDSLVCYVGTDPNNDIVTSISNDGGLSWIPSTGPIEQVPGCPEFRIDACTPGGGRIHVLTRLEGGGCNTPEEGEGLYLLSSSDAGVSWTHPRRIDEGDAFGGGFWKLVATENGDVVVLWNDLPPGASAFNVLSRRVSADGTTFEPIVPVNSIGPGQVSLSDAISLANGRIVVLFSLETSASPFDNSLYSTVSMDGGRSFGLHEGPVSTDLDGDKYEGGSSLSAGCDGRIVAHWARIDRFVGEISLHGNFSRDGGVTWLSREVRLDGNLGVRNTTIHGTSPAAMLSGGAVVFPWHEWVRFAGVSSGYVTAVTPNVLLSAGTDDSVVPAEGGNVLLEFWVRNDSASTFENIPASVDLRLPDGSLSEPLAGPLTLSSLAPGREIRGTRTFSIAGSLPPGGYALNLRLGSPVSRVGSRCFIKLP